MPVLTQDPTLGDLLKYELNANYWGAVFAPASTPKPVLARLHDIINKAHDMPEVKEKFQSNQMIPVVSPTIEDAIKWNAGEVDRWRKNFKDSGIDKSEIK